MNEQTDSKVPQIRFKGFDGSWEEKILGTLCLIGDADHWMPKTTSQGIPYIMTGDFCGLNEIDFGNAKLISEADYEKLSRKIKPEIDDILFARYASVGAVRLVRTARRFIVSYSCAILKNNSSFSSQFLFYLLQSGRSENQLKQSINTGSQGNVGIESLKQLVTIFPDMSEQTKIGDFFRELDSLITLHQRKHDKLLALKKAMLQKMFPQPGATTPEIRFKGFSGDWVQKNVQDICGETYGGGTPATANRKFWEGEIPWIQSSDITDGQIYRVVPRKYINSLALRKSPTKLIPGYSIAIVSRVGVGKLALIEFNYATSQDFLSLSKLKIDPAFAVVLLSILLQSKLHETQGTSIKGITKEELLAYSFMLPIADTEQQKIGTYFRTLDELIGKQATQLQKLQQIKSACLEKMFV